MVINFLAVISSLSALNVCTILGDRLDLSTLDQKKSPSAERVVRTVSGREITADLIVSTLISPCGQKLIRSVAPLHGPSTEHRPPPRGVP